MQQQIPESRQRVLSVSTLTCSQQASSRRQIHLLRVSKDDQFAALTIAAAFQLNGDERHIEVLLLFTIADL